MSKAKRVMNVKREWGTFAQATASVVERKIEFGGQTYEPDRGKAFVEAILCHSLPTLNSARRGWTAATLANSVHTASQQLVDFSHRLKFYENMYGSTNDRICGTIVGAEFPEKKVAMELAAEGKSVPVRVLLAVFRKAEDIEDTLAEIAGESNPWRLSIECEYRVSECALWDGEKFYPWIELSEEQRKLVLPNTVDAMDGKEMGLICGGEDGHVLITGCALTRRPRDKGAEIQQMAAGEIPQGAIFINAGWKSTDDYMKARGHGDLLETGQATGGGTVKKPAKGSIVKAALAAELTIGRTSPAEDGHVHDILRDLTVMPAAEHSHCAIVKDVDLAEGTVKGATNSYYQSIYNAGGSYVGSTEHSHTFALGPAAVRTAQGGETHREEVAMKPKELAAWFRKQAAELKGTNAEAAEKLEHTAAEMEKNLAAGDAEEVVAARIKAGDLIPKAQHETALAEAKKAGHDEFAKELADKEEAKKAAEQALASRIEKVKAAKLDPKFTLGVNKTIETEIASMPAGEAGDKRFAEALADWAVLAKNTGQAVASDDGDTQQKPIVPVGGGSAAVANGAKISALGMF